MVIAGAVFLGKGSSIIACGFTLISLICSATINLCSSLHIIIGANVLGISDILSWVICSNDFLIIFNY